MLGYFPSIYAQQGSGEGLVSASRVPKKGTSLCLSKLQVLYFVLLQAGAAILCTKYTSYWMDSGSFHWGGITVQKYALARYYGTVPGDPRIVEGRIGRIGEIGGSYSV